MGLISRVSSRTYRYTWEKFGKRFFFIACASFGTVAAYHYLITAVRDQNPRDVLSGTRQIEIYQQRKALQEQFERDLKEQMVEVDEKNKIRREVFEAQQRM